MAFFLLFLSISAFSNSIRPAYVEGTELFVTRKDGTKVTGQKLIGAVIVGQNDNGQETSFRIDKIEKDHSDKDGDVFLYTFSIKDQETSKWIPYCTPDQHGVAAGFPLSGSWDNKGTHLRDDQFSITCTSGVIGKCIRFGYKPWKKDLWDYHQACTRMLRADYCGNGVGHTKDGTPIDITDRLIHTSDDNKTLAFEAGWNSQGATCIARTRLAEWTLESIVKECPIKLKGKTGPGNCSPKKARNNKKAILFNKS